MQRTFKLSRLFHTRKKQKMNPKDKNNRADRNLSKNTQKTSAKNQIVPPIKDHRDKNRAQKNELPVKGLQYAPS